MIGRQFFGMRGDGLHRSDVHRHIFQNGSVLAGTFGFEQHAGLAVVVSVDTHRAFRAKHASHDHLFADLADNFFEQIAELLTWTIRSGLCEQLVRS